MAGTEEGVHAPRKRHKFTYRPSSLFITLLFGFLYLFQTYPCANGPSSHVLLSTSKLARSAQLQSTAPNLAPNHDNKRSEWRAAFLFEPGSFVLELGSVNITTRGITSHRSNYSTQFFGHAYIIQLAGSP